MRAIRALLAVVALLNCGSAARAQALANPPISCASGNVAAGTTACTLAGVVGKTTYISGFAMTASGATAGLAVNCTLTGVIGGTQTYTFSYPAGVLVGATPLTVTFSPPLPASATNTAVTPSCPSGGSGAAHAAMNAWGYQQ